MNNEKITQNHTIRQNSVKILLFSQRRETFLVKGAKRNSDKLSWDLKSKIQNWDTPKPNTSKSIPLNNPIKCRYYQIEYSKFGFHYC